VFDIRESLGRHCRQNNSSKYTISTLPSANYKTKHLTTTQKLTPRKIHRENNKAQNRAEEPPRSSSTFAQSSRTCTPLKPQLAKYKVIANSNPFPPALVPFLETQIMNMPRPLDLCQSYFTTPLAHCSGKSDRRVERHDLVLCAVDQERGRGVGAITEVREWGDGGDEVRGRRRGPGLAVGGTDAVEQKGKAVAFFEEGQDELGAGVAGPDPAEVAAVGGARAGGVGCYLLV